MFNKLSWFNYSEEDQEAKLRERQKKIEYGNILKEQMEEKKRREQEEKIKRLRDDEKYNQLYENEFERNARISNPYVYNTKQKYNTYTPSKNDKFDNNTIPVTPSNQNNNTFLNNNLPNTFQLAVRQNNIELYFKDFVQEQINVINAYEQALDEVLLQKRDNNPYSFSNNVNIEYNRAISKIRNEQNKLKETIGFFPLEENYNRKIEELFNKILAKKILMYNTIQSGNDVIYYDEVNLEQNKKLKELEYKSKYENLKDTVPNFDEMDKEDKVSLIGFSKLVQIDNGNKEDDNFLITWRDNLMRKDTQPSNLGLQRYNTNDNIDHKKDIQKLNDNNGGMIMQEEEEKKEETDDGKQEEKNNKEKERKNKEKKRIKEKKAEARRKHKINNEDEDNKEDYKKYEKIENSTNMKKEKNKMNQDGINTVHNNKRNELNNGNNLKFYNQNYFSFQKRSSTKSLTQKDNKDKKAPSTEDEKIKNSTVSYYYKHSEDTPTPRKSSNSDHYDNATLNPDKLHHLDKPPTPVPNNTHTNNDNEAYFSDEESIKEIIEQSDRSKQIKSSKVLYHNIDSANFIKPPKHIDIPSQNRKRHPFSENIKRFNEPYENDELQHTVMNDPNLPMGTGDETPSHNNVKKNKKHLPLGGHSLNNSKNISQLSDNDSILKDLDRFRQIALNGIGNLDNPNIVQLHSKNRTVDLIPKDVIKNYDKLISSGSRK